MLTENSYVPGAAVITRSQLTMPWALANAVPPGPLHIAGKAKISNGTIRMPMSGIGIPSSLPVAATKEIWIAPGRVAPDAPVMVSAPVAEVGANRTVPGCAGPVGPKEEMVVN